MCVSVCASLVSRRQSNAVKCVQIELKMNVRAIPHKCVCACLPIVRLLFNCIDTITLVHIRMHWFIVSNDNILLYRAVEIFVFFLFLLKFVPTEIKILHKIKQRFFRRQIGFSFNLYMIFFWFSSNPFTFFLQLKCPDFKESKCVHTDTHDDKKKIRNNKNN